MWKQTPFTVTLLEQVGPQDLLVVARLVVARLVVARLARLLDLPSMVASRLSGRFVIPCFELLGPLVGLLSPSFGLVALAALLVAPSLGLSLVASMVELLATPILGLGREAREVQGCRAVRARGEPGVLVCGGQGRAGTRGSGGGGPRERARGDVRGRHKE